MILARITSQYDDVYFLAIDSSVSRSSLERFTLNGLFLGIRDTIPLMQAYQITSPIHSKNTSSYFRIVVLSHQFFDLSVEIRIILAPLAETLVTDTGSHAGQLVGHTFLGGIKEH